jgi:hypothetical protein
VTTPIGYPTAGEFGGALTADVTFPAQKPDYTTVPASPGGFAILHDLPGKPIAEYSASLDRTGAQDMSALLSDCWAEYALRGDPWALGAGNFLNNSPLYLVSYSHGVLSSRATLIRNFSTLGVGGHITQQSFTAPLTNVRWQGGKIRNPSTSNGGNVFSLFCSDSEFSDFFIDEWEGRAFLLHGYRNRIHDFAAVSVRDGGGVRIDGGADNVISNFYIACGDDCCIASVTGSALTGIAGLSTVRNQFVNGIANSWNARACMAGNDGTPTDGQGSIDDISFIGITGKGRSGARVGNDGDSPHVTNIQFSGCLFDISGETESPAVGISVGGNATYPVRDVTFVNTVVKAPALGALLVNDGAVGVRFTDCVFEAPTEDRETVRVESADVVFTNCYFGTKNGQNTFRVGVAGTPANFEVRGGRMDGIANAKYGINLSACSRAVVEDVRFSEVASSTTARAITVGASAANADIRRNDYSGLSAAERLTWAPTAGNGSRADAPAVISVSANTNVRAHQSGTTFVLTGTTGRNFALPAAASGLRYRGVQQGSGAMTFTAGSGDVIQVGASTSSAAGTTVSGSVGATIELVALDDTTWLATSSSGTWTVT